MSNNGKVYLVGIGPGNIEKMTIEAVEAIKKSDVIVGYKVYIELIEELINGKEVISSGMRKEIERCKMVLDLAKEGKKVALISSGDAGIYGMAGPLLELASKDEREVEVVVIPGVTAANASAAVLGSPVMHDTARISLSDLLTPWEVIEKRLDLASQGDFIITLYNPRSKGRPDYIVKARDISLKYRKEDTPVGIVKNAGRDGERKIITTLKDMRVEEIDMFSTVIIGNSNTYSIKDKMITPRGYII